MEIIHSTACLLLSGLKWSYSIAAVSWPLRVVHNTLFHQLTFWYAVVQDADSSADS